MYKNLIDFIRELYQHDGSIPLHEPNFNQEEKQILSEVIESTYVSSVGGMVDEFEKEIKDFTDSKHAITTVNGTAALHLSLLLSGIDSRTEVITQSLTFVAVSNAIQYCGASPIFLDVDLDSLSLSPDNLKSFLLENCELRDDGLCWNKSSNRQIKACIIMHTFGLPGRIDELKGICKDYNIILIEDAAESLGSFYKNSHTGTLTNIGILSFNGNKIITTGGGGMLLIENDELAKNVKHLSTTAKKPHPWLFEHDAIGFNYRMPNLNAALGLAQIKKLPSFISTKRKIAAMYQQWGKDNNYSFISELSGSKSNYWLNTLISKNAIERDAIIKETNSVGIMTRPAWTPMHLLKINDKYQVGNLRNTEWLFDRIVNVPSGIPNNLYFINSL